MFWLFAAVYSPCNAQATCDLCVWETHPHDTYVRIMCGYAWMRGVRRCAWGGCGRCMYIFTCVCAYVSGIFQWSTFVQCDVRVWVQMWEESSSVLHFGIVESVHTSALREVMWTIVDSISQPRSQLARWTCYCILHEHDGLFVGAGAWALQSSDESLNGCIKQH